MENRFSSLKCREVVNVCDGCRLGFVSDVTLDLKCGRVLALIVPGPARVCGVLGRREDFVIPWGCVRQIGDDLILIDGELDKFRRPRTRKGIL